MFQKPFKPLYKRPKPYLFFIVHRAKYCFITSSMTVLLSACGGGGADNPADNGASMPVAPASSPASGGNNNNTGNITPPDTSASSPSGDGNSSSNNGSSNNNGSGSNNGSDSNNGSSSNNGSGSLPSQKISCINPVTGSANTTGNIINADTPSTDQTRLFPYNTDFPLQITTQAPANDSVIWSVSDTLGNTVATGTFNVTASPTLTTLTCHSTISGYFAIHANLKNAGNGLLSAGTRPQNIATFGVIPDTSQTLSAINYTKQDQHRFGMQGFNDFGAMLTDLGISSTIDDREMSAMEPNTANTFNPQADNLDSFYKSGQIMRLIRLDGIPAWASSTGAFQDSYALPASLSYYQNYMSRVGTESVKIQKTYFPKQVNNYYQVTWEPSWQNSDSDFVSLYKAAYTGLHSTDSNAVVMGPADPFPSLTTSRLQRLAPLGFNQYIDAVATHGYYDAGTSPSHPPERLATDPDPANAANALMNEMHNLREEMVTDYRSGMKLFVTETGISYDLGTSYSATYPTDNVLYAQAAVVARTHIILLGEGANQTYVFYGADYPGEVGYGTFFDLDHAQGQFGATNISPKPAALAVSAMTHVLDGTTTLGALKNMPSGLYAYAFQQINSGDTITALWTHNNNVWNSTSGFSSTYSQPYSLQVDSPGTSGSVIVLDMMGNPSTMTYSNGTLNLNLKEAPIYVISKNSSIATANSTLPVGYIPN